MPDLNPLPLQPTTRQPRGAVKINGEVVPGWESWETDNNAYRSADTFRVVFVASELPTTRDAAWFSDQSAMTVEIFANPAPALPGSYQPDATDSLILGNVDDIDYNPVAGTIEVSGRDLTALLIDTKTTEHFKEKKSSDVAILLAQRHGLTPVVTATKDVIGKYYEYDRVTLTQEQSEWEILTYLANVEDFMVYVRGNELHFEPRPAESADHYVIAYDPPNADRNFPVSNAVELNFTRSLTIAKGVAVEVRSWNAKKGGAPIVATFPKNAKGAAPGKAASKTQVYKRFFPHLTAAEALKRAESIYRQIIAHERRMTGYLPADNLLTCRTTLQVRGTGTSCDQIYYPDSVARSMSMDEGYRMNIRAKNTGPELEALT